MATVSWPPVTTSCTFSERGSTMVSGPGQNRAASFCAFSGTMLAQRCRYLGLSRWTMTGWSAGRSFSSKMRRTADGFCAFAPRP